VRATSTRANARSAGSTDERRSVASGSSTPEIVVLDGSYALTVRSGRPTSSHAAGEDRSGRSTPGFIQAESGVSEPSAVTATAS
jgi:hypothetical protein